MTRTVKAEPGKDETAVAKADTQPAAPAGPQPKDAKAVAGVAQQQSQGAQQGAPVATGSAPHRTNVAVRPALGDVPSDGKPDYWRIAVSRAQIKERDLTESERVNGRGAAAAGQ